MNIKNLKQNLYQKAVSMELLVGFLKFNFFVVKFLSILNDVPDKAAAPRGFSSKLLKPFLKSLFISIKHFYVS